MITPRELLQLRLETKYHMTSSYADACGNTFLIVDALDHDLDHEAWQRIKEEIWTLLSHTDVDDALVLRKIAADEHTLELKMHVLEPDGTEADFCGNGARAVGKYLYSNYRHKYERFFLISRKGKHAFKENRKGYFVDLGTPHVHLEKQVFYSGGTAYAFRFVDCIEPHLVTEDFFDLKLLNKVGHEICKQWRSRYPHGVNVNCFRKNRDNTLEVMTFERGLYRVTAACGTGSTACCASALKQYSLLVSHQYEIHVLGGILEILCEDQKFWLGGAVMLK